MIPNSYKGFLIKEKYSANHFEASDNQQVRLVNSFLKQLTKNFLSLPINRLLIRESILRRLLHVVRL